MPYAHLTVRLHMQKRQAWRWRVSWGNRRWRQLLEETACTALWPDPYPALRRTLTEIRIGLSPCMIRESFDSMATEWFASSKTNKQTEIRLITHRLRDLERKFAFSRFTWFALHSFISLATTSISRNVFGFEKKSPLFDAYILLKILLKEWSQPQNKSFGLSSLPSPFSHPGIVNSGQPMMSSTMPIAMQSTIQAIRHWSFMHFTYLWFA